MILAKRSMGEFTSGPGRNALTALAFNPKIETRFCVPGDVRNDHVSALVIVAGEPDPANVTAPPASVPVGPTSTPFTLV